MTSATTRSDKRPKKPKAPNAIETALTSWFATLPIDALENHDVAALTAQAPRRWVVYEPMVLLPAGSFQSEPWQGFLSSVPEPATQDLWLAILTQISKTLKTPLTHLAANEGIPLHSSDAEENVLRSPSGLRVLYGDFGPRTLDQPETGATVVDFEKAFWVSTKQNGIYQTWAPRWTMFSRGNVKEKARLLEFHSPTASETGCDHRRMDRTELRKKWAIDLYAGIGYFVFSYAKLELRILCWELNPWSVEGLRRGALGNGWGVRVIQGQELETASLEALLDGPERIVVFLESNEMAGRRVAQLDVKKRQELKVKHVNCGFLPTSEPTWTDAWDMVLEDGKAWLHLHENVGVHDIEKRKEEIQEMFNNLAGEKGSKRAVVEKVELVKTFAPGVWHCVFDVYITGSDNIT